MPLLPDFDGPFLDVVNRDLPAFLPELLLCTAIVLLLVLRLFPSFSRMHPGCFALLVTVAALAVSVCQWGNFYVYRSPDNNDDPTIAAKTSIPDARKHLDTSLRDLAKVKAQAHETTLNPADDIATAA